jgi:hypothetical protein
MLLSCILLGALSDERSGLSFVSQSGTVNKPLPPVWRFRPLCAPITAPQSNSAAPGGAIITWLHSTSGGGGVLCNCFIAHMVSAHIQHLACGICRLGNKLCNSAAAEFLEYP